MRTPARPRPAQRRYSRSQQVVGLVNLAAIVASVFFFPALFTAIVASIAGVVMAVLFVLALIGGRGR